MIVSQKYGEKWILVQYQDAMRQQLLKNLPGIRSIGDRHAIGPNYKKVASVGD